MWMAGSSGRVKPWSVRLRVKKSRPASDVINNRVASHLVARGAGKEGRTQPAGREGPNPALDAEGGGVGGGREGRMEGKRREEKKRKEGKERREEEKKGKKKGREERKKKKGKKRKGKKEGGEKKGKERKEKGRERKKKERRKEKDRKEHTSVPPGGARPPRRGCEAAHKVRMCGACGRRAPGGQARRAGQKSVFFDFLSFLGRAGILKLFFGFLVALLYDLDF